MGLSVASSGCTPTGRALGAGRRAARVSILLLLSLSLMLSMMLTLAGCQGKGVAQKDLGGSAGAEDVPAAAPTEEAAELPAEEQTSKDQAAEEQASKDQAAEEQGGKDETANGQATGTEPPQAAGAQPFEPVMDGDVIVIKEKMFVAQSNDIYYNSDEYLGRTIRYEGIFKIYDDPVMEERYYSVIRYGPGCCGIDQNAGFEISWDGTFPKLDDWVEVEGILEEYEEYGETFLRLDLTKMNVLTKRGAEYVTQ
jgi:uncharacterized membrane protein YcgQ (UPF0703/DUF1980 family)